MKKYIKIEGKNTELKIEVYYHKGGLNYFTYKNEPRGYYVSVLPVEIQRMDNGIVMESFAAFSGIKSFLKEVSRKSNKGYNDACIIAEGVIPELTEKVLAKVN